MLVEELAEDIGREFPDPLTSTVERAIVRAFREFAVKSEAWRLTYSQAVTIGTGEYYLPLPDDSYILALDSVTFTPAGGTARNPVTHVAAFDAEFASSGAPTQALIEDEAIYFNRVGEEGTFTVEVKLAPLFDIAEIPDEVATKYYSTIRNGGIYELLKVPGQAWMPKVSRADLNDFKMSFLDGIQEARREARGDRSRPSRKAKYGGIPIRNGRRRNRSMY